MPRILQVACLVAMGVGGVAEQAHAQRFYPGGYGRYGWGGWGMGMGLGGGGVDPAAGYMAGLGTFARDQGVYQVENARAQSINLDTMIKWNKELRARQQQLKIE